MPRWAVVLLVVASGVVAITALGLFAFGYGDEVAGRAVGTTTEESSIAGTTIQGTKPSASIGKLVVRIRDGRPVGGLQELTVRRGAAVSILVVSDVEDEVHVHGYDLMDQVGPGKTAEILFVATLAGRFEIELEDRGTPIAELEVRP